MAKESSFDIVSTVDMQEIDNAFQQAKKELAQRYDLKDSGAEITLDKAGKSMTGAGPPDDAQKGGAVPGGGRPPPISWPSRSST